MVQSEYYTIEEVEATEQKAVEIAQQSHTAMLEKLEKRLGQQHAEQLNILRDELEKDKQKALEAAKKKYKAGLADVEAAFEHSVSVHETALADCRQELDEAEKSLGRITADHRRRRLWSQLRRS